MMREDLLIRHTRRLLGEFVAPMLEAVDKPRKRFVQQAIRGILFSGSVVVMELSRWVRDDCSDRFYRVKRLLSHLSSPEGDLTVAVRRYRQAAVPHIPPDTALILAGEKPKMPFLEARLTLQHCWTGATAGTERIDFSPTFRHWAPFQRVVSPNTRQAITHQCDSRPLPLHMTSP